MTVKHSPEGGPPRWWLAPGLLLPRSIRKQVYEPCCLDLWRRHCTTARHTQLGASLRLAGYVLAGAWYGLPTYLYDGGRPTRLGRVLGYAFILFMLTVLVSLFPWIAHVASAGNAP